LISKISASGSRIALTAPEERLMPIAKITGQGLAAIALSVALLWACLVGERMTLNKAVVRRAQVMRELKRMQIRHQTQPASIPVQRPYRPAPATIG
jgi:hypothetical protein